MWARKDKEYVTRDCVCKCGKPFTQKMVSNQFVKTFLKQGRALEMFKIKSPRGFLPVWCVPCERKALGVEAGAVPPRRDFL